MNWIYNDGGRSAAGFQGKAGDCVVRAIAIATRLPYIEVYEDINLLANKTERVTKAKKHISSASRGVYKQTTRKYIKSLGWKWTPTMFVGSGCKVHLKASELPKGRIICQLSKHLVAVVDGVMHDTFDSSRDETRCVYGYWEKSD